MDWGSSTSLCTSLLLQVLCSCSLPTLYIYSSLPNGWTFNIEESLGRNPLCSPILLTCLRVMGYPINCPYKATMIKLQKIVSCPSSYLDGQHNKLSTSKDPPTGCPLYLKICSPLHLSAPTPSLSCPSVLVCRGLSTSYKKEITPPPYRTNTPWKWKLSDHLLIEKPVPHELSLIFMVFQISDWKVPFVKQLWGQLKAHSFTKYHFCSRNKCNQLITFVKIKN